jgi:hypothetical protein
MGTQFSRVSLRNNRLLILVGSEFHPRTESFGQRMLPGIMLSALSSLTQETSKKASESLVVITHHAPSARSIPHRYQNGPVNPAFASNLDKLSPPAESLCGFTATFTTGQITFSAAPELLQTRAGILMKQASNLIHRSCWKFEIPQFSEIQRSGRARPVA